MDKTFVTGTPYFDKYDFTLSSKRHLPHWQQDGKLTFITYRLADSLPREVRESFYAERADWMACHPKPWSLSTSKEYHYRFPARMERLLDLGVGSCILKDKHNALLVEENLLYHHQKKYILMGYVVMPNHVHVIIITENEMMLDEILHSWKSYTSKKLIGWPYQSQQKWEQERYDRIVRDANHYENLKGYLMKNFQMGGIIIRIEDWRQEKE